jgi:copper homeostasis protein
MTFFFVEVCVESVESAARAIAGGAHRLEVCSSLVEGGITPSMGLLSSVLALARPSRTPVRVLIRPRPGDFLYSEAEILQIEAEIDHLPSEIDGIVFGAAQLDEARSKAELSESICRRVLGRARSRGINGATLHRVVDVLPEDTTTADENTAYWLGLASFAEKIGFDTILSSGAATTAADGVPNLVLLQSGAAHCKVSVMAGAGVNAGNARGIVEAVRCQWVHGSFREKVGGVGGRGELLGMGGARWVTSEGQVREVTEEREVSFLSFTR